MHKVLFTGNTFSLSTIEDFKEKGIEIIPAPDHLTEEELIRSLQGIEAVIVNGGEYYSETVLKSTPDLKLIQFFGIGYQACVDKDLAEQYGKVVMNTPKVNSYSVAEFTLGLIFALNQKLLQYDQEICKGIWQEKTFFDLQNKTIGIIGMGHIGSHLAEIMYHAFHAKILYYDQREKKEQETLFGAQKVSLEQLFKESDIVSLHLPLTDDTQNLIDRNLFSLMKKEAYFINTARAEIVDFESLYEALSTHQIAGCAFDGFYQEPVDLTKKEAKLLSLPTGSFLLTPHAGYNAIEATSRMENMCIHHLFDFFGINQ